MAKVELRRLVLDVLQQRHGHVIGEDHVELPGDKTKDRCRAIGYDGPFDPVEVRPVWPPVIGIAGNPYALVWLVLDKLERACTDRKHAHVLGRDVAGIDR